MRNRVAARWIRRVAADVGTDTGEIYAIAPEQLTKIIEEGEWAELAKDLAKNHGEMGDIIREHGGATFGTGGDGTWDVTIKVPRAMSMSCPRKDTRPPNGKADS